MYTQARHQTRSLQAAGATKHLRNYGHPRDYTWPQTNPGGITKPHPFSSPLLSTTMSGTESVKKSGYRIEYASSARAKCKGTSLSQFPSVHPIIVRLPSNALFRSQTVSRYSPQRLSFPAPLLTSRPSGTTLAKGDLRFGYVDFWSSPNRSHLIYAHYRSLVDFRGKISLYLSLVYATSSIP